MALGNLTNAELLLNMDNQKILTPAEVELTERLRDAMDEIHELERTVRELHREAGR